MTNIFKLGDKVSVETSIYKYTIDKTRQWDDWKFSDAVTLDYLKAFDATEAALTPLVRAITRWNRFDARPFNGVIVGARTLFDYEHIEEWGKSEGFEGETQAWIKSEVKIKRIRSFKAYIVSFNLHRKPVFVLPEDIKLLESESE